MSEMTVSVVQDFRTANAPAMVANRTRSNIGKMESAKLARDPRSRRPGDGFGSAAPAPGGEQGGAFATACRWQVAVAQSLA
ncbi:hypothetical protein NP284_03335 [Rhodopseudomonas pseudopalustris]|uniref:hypothetical protein n=1 Tax=Rhodopseudomonas pseudopalustris TaxID=1513892 RepID=UPI003F964EC2